MKKSSRITNTIKYFGISSATLLAAAPVVAPTVTNVLGWYEANSAFTAKTSDKAEAATELGAFDRTGYSEYDNLFQNNVKISLQGDTVEPAAMQTIESDVKFTPDRAAVAQVEPELDANGNIGILGKYEIPAIPGHGTVGDKGVHYGVLEGIQQLAKLTGVDGTLPVNIFGDNDVQGKNRYTSEDLRHYLFTNTDGSSRTASEGLSTTAKTPMYLRTPLSTIPDTGNRVSLGIKYLSTYLNGGTVKGILGSSIFGNPNKATVKVYIDGKDGHNTPSMTELLSEGVITITLVAQSGDYHGRTAQANIILRNTSVLLKGAKLSEVDAGTKIYGNDGGFNNPGTIVYYLDNQLEDKEGNKIDNNNILSNTAGLKKALPQIFTAPVPDGSRSISYIPKDAVPTFQAAPTADSGFFNGNWNDISATDENYFAGKEASGVANSPINGSFNENVGAYATGSIVVPKGTSYNTIVKHLDKVKYIGTPSSDDYGNTPVQEKHAIAFDSVKAKAGNISGNTWHDLLDQSGVLKNNFFDYNGGSGTPVKDTNNAVVGHSFSIDVPVYGDLKVAGQSSSTKFVKGLNILDTMEDFGYQGREEEGVWDNYETDTNITATGLDSDIGNPWNPSWTFEPGGNHMNPTTSNTGAFHEKSKIMKWKNLSPIDIDERLLFPSPAQNNHTLVKDYGYSQDRVTARVNVIVYDTGAPKYSIGTKPSFLFYNKSNTSNAIYSTLYDDGSTLSRTELPETLSQGLQYTVNDPRFTTNGVFSSQKLASYVAEKFGQAVTNKEILISDEDKATSNKKVDLSNLPADTDFPNADKYTQRSDNKGKNITVDASKVDLSKAGSGTLTITYTNSKNEHGVGTETSTITVPYQVGVSTNPVFFFTRGTNETISVGDDFNAMAFKVTLDQSSMDDLISSGKVYDGAPYVNDPARTGLNVTVSGSVDTNTPGNYILTYTATNVATGAITTLTRNVTVLSKSESGSNDFDVNDFQAIGYINYVPGYGVNVYDGPNGKFTGQRLQHATAWKIFHQATSRKNSKDVWYEVGKNQWVKGEYLSMTPVSHMKPLSAVGRINYVPGYGVKVWSNTDGTGWNGKYLQHGTDWRVFGEDNGYYNLGGNQWVSKQYIELVSSN